jgi:hypothetical protein
MQSNEPQRDTLAEAQAKVGDTLQSGEMMQCPCCTQTVKKYPRRVYKTVALCLRAVANSGEDGLLPKEIVTRVSAIHPISGNHHTKLALWGLIKRNPMDGRWRATDRGRDFLAGRERIEKYAHVFNGRVLGYSEDTVDIKEIAKEFDLTELLNPKTLDE